MICEDWFDYENLCHDSTCDGNTRMSLLPDTVNWMKTHGLTPTSSVFCEIKAPWPLRRNNQIEVKLVCQQICDKCPPST